MALNGTFAVHVGNCVADPDLHFTPGGAPVCTVRVAVNSRQNKGDGWEARDAALFFDATGWFDTAENMAETLTKGMRVIVAGDMFSREWTDRDDNTRTSLEMEVAEIGPSLRFAEAKVTQNERNGDGRDGRDRDDDRDDRGRGRRGERRARDDRDDRGGRSRRGGGRRESEREPRGSSRRDDRDDRGGRGRRSSVWDDDSEGD
jgi:single-strand DNA-binding protein